LLVVIALIGGSGGIAALAAQSAEVGRSPRSTTKPWAEPDTVPVVLQRTKGDGLPSRVFDLFDNRLLIDIQDDFCGYPPIAAYYWRDDTVFVSVEGQPAICVPEYTGSRYVAAMELPYEWRPLWHIRFSMPTHRGRDTLLTLPPQ
jgi:hypothetical protein